MGYQQNCWIVWSCRKRGAKTTHLRWRRYGIFPTRRTATGAARRLLVSALYHRVLLRCYGELIGRLPAKPYKL